MVEPKGNALAVAESAAGDVRGKEGIDQGDLILPRLALCQALSPEKDADDAKYIDGLKEGDLFNTLTGTVYGRGPVTVAIIRLDKRALEFEKGPDGKPTKRILDFNVPWNDARCEFTDGANGRQKPEATRFYDFLALSAETLEPVVLSMSNTKIKAAKRLNSLLAIRPGAAWAGLFKVSSVREEKDGNKYFNYKIDPAGPTPADVQAIAETLYTQFATKNVAVDRGDPDVEGDGKIPF